MGTIDTKQYTSGLQSNYDRADEVKAFDDTKMGVKGLLDLGTKTIPMMFIRPDDELQKEHATPCVELQYPVVDLEGIDRKECYDKIVEEVLSASEKWGFFQVINHGIPLQVMDNMLHGVKMFHEQHADAKKVFYTRDMSKSVVFASNFDLHKSRSADWRDSLAIFNSYPGHLDPNHIPDILRDVAMDFINHVMKLGDILLELLSVGLGLRPSYLKEEMECSKGWSFINQYYPACPAPELTLGISKHSDPSFLSIVLQDQIGGLQVLHHNQWVPVRPTRGAFVVQVGDILQIITNDRLKSVYHRVKAHGVGPRMSSLLFLRGPDSSPKLYKPIDDLLSEEHPAIYKEFTIPEFRAHFLNHPSNEPRLAYWKVKNHDDHK